MNLSMNFSEVLRLADELEGAPARLIAGVRPAMKRGAYNIKRDAVTRAQAFVAGGAGYARLYPSSISYDVEETSTKISAEIGPDKNRAQGALGNLIEFGSSNNAPMPHLMPAAAREIPKTEIQLSRAALRAVLL